MPELIQQQTPDYVGNILKSYQFGQQAKANQLKILAAQQEMDIKKQKFEQTQVKNILAKRIAAGDRDAIREMYAYDPAIAESAQKREDYSDVQGARVLDAFDTLPQYARNQKRWEQMHNDYREATGRELPLPANFPSERNDPAIAEFNALKTRLKGREQDLKEQYQAAQIKTEGFQQAKYGVDIQKVKQDMVKGNIDIAKSRGEFLDVEQERALARDQGITLGTFKKQQEEIGKVRGEKATLLQSASSKLPQLFETVNKLSKLGETATYTGIGVAINSATRQLGMDVSQGAINRKEYIATIDNEILPLLRDIFGAQFTLEEGNSLKGTLGDPNSSPEEKEAILNSFIETKIRNLNSGARELGIEPLNPTIVSKGKYSIINGKIIKEGKTATDPQTGQKMVFRGGKWQNQ